MVDDLIDDDVRVEYVSAPFNATPSQQLRLRMSAADEAFQYGGAISQPGSTDRDHRLVEAETDRT
jgi:hypothetical protein